MSTQTEDGWSIMCTWCAVQHLFEPYVLEWCCRARQTLYAFAVIKRASGSADKLAQATSTGVPVTDTSPQCHASGLSDGDQWQLVRLCCGRSERLVTAPARKVCSSLHLDQSVLQGSMR
eukprot:jgi/Ulvmu1/10745/UM068_0035.1